MTTQQTTRVVPAGWYEDPVDDTKVRWWNGLTWTEHVELKPAGAQAASAGALAIESGASAAADQRAAQDRDLEMSRRTAMALDARGPSTGTIPIQGVAAPRRPARTSTTSSWLLAVTPLITSVLAVVGAYVFFYVTPTPLVFAVAVVLYLLGFLWAVGDSRALEARGVKGPSAALALALPLVGPLLYLIARRRITPGSQLIVFVALLVVAVLAPLGVGVAGGAQTVTKALEVQQAVSADLVDSGAATSVTCPPIVETVDAGSVFTCDAVLPNGDTAHVWVSFDDEQGNFSWALANR